MTRKQKAKREVMFFSLEEKRFLEEVSVYQHLSVSGPILAVIRHGLLGVRLVDEGHLELVQGYSTG